MSHLRKMLKKLKYQAKIKQTVVLLHKTDFLIRKISLRMGSISKAECT